MTKANEIRAVGQRLAGSKPEGETDIAWAETTLGIKRGTWANYVKETTSPSLELLIRIQELTGVSLDWLATGRGPRTVEINDWALRVAIAAALDIVERDRHSRKDGTSSYTLESIAAQIATFYGDMTKLTVDELKAKAQSLGVAANQEASDAEPVSGNRKTHP